MEAIVLGDFGESITPLLAFSLNVQVKHILFVSSGLFGVEKVYSTWQKYQEFRANFLTRVQIETLSFYHSMC